MRAVARRMSVTNYGSVTYEPSLGKKHKNVSPNSMQNEKLGTIANDFENVRADLIKIVILASLIIGLQIFIKISNINFL